MPITISESEIETFIVDNWHNMFDFKYLERQKTVDVGIIDILGYDENAHEYVVIEIKTDDADDSAVGQIQRYMGWVAMNLCKKPERVRGIIVTHGANNNLACALKVTSRVEWYAYQLNPIIYKMRDNMIEDEPVDLLGRQYISATRVDVYYEYDQIPLNQQHEKAPCVMIIKRDGVEVSRSVLNERFDYSDPWKLIRSHQAELNDEISIVRKNNEIVAKMTIRSKE